VRYANNGFYSLTEFKVCISRMGRLMAQSAWPTAADGTVAPPAPLDPVIDDGTVEQRLVVG
jgi:hypothetical protein